jgi:segregation and condensation protein B
MKLNSQIESLLLVSDRALSLTELSKLLKEEKKVIKEALDSLSKDYRENNRGFNIVENNNAYQLSSSADNSDLVANFLKADISGELSQASLEALTIIAYRQPITKEEIEKIRGVNCSLIIRNLLMRGLIEEKFDQSKQVNYYYVSLDFVRYLGISRVEELPDYEKLSKQEN